MYTYRYILILFEILHVWNGGEAAEEDEINEIKKKKK
jgi:hypothetical protein